MATETWKTKYHRNLREIVESYPVNQEFALEEIREKLLKRSITVKIMSISNVLSGMRIARISQMGQGPKKPSKWIRAELPAVTQLKPRKKTPSTTEKKKLVVQIVEEMPPGKQFMSHEIIKRVREMTGQSVSWQLVAGQLKEHKLATSVRTKTHWIWERNEARPLPCCGTLCPNAHTPACREIICRVCRHPVTQTWPCDAPDHLNQLRRKETDAITKKGIGLLDGALCPSPEVPEGTCMPPTVYLPAPEKPKEPRPDPAATVTLDDLGVTLTGPISGITEVMRAYKNWIEFKATWKYPERKRS